jgi:type VI secretion system protein ImpF
MAELSLREQLQPALLDRLTDDERVVTVFEISVDPRELQRLALPLRDLVSILETLGLRDTSGSGAQTPPAGEPVRLEFAAPGRSVSLSQLKELLIKPPGAAGRGIKVQEFCSVQAHTMLNTHTESIERRVVSMRRLRESVFRDLVWLLNSMSLDTTEDLSRYPHVERSVLNYGMPSLAGRKLVTLDPEYAATRIQKVIETFEPRLSRVRVTPDIKDDGTERFALEFRVEAELWGQPAPQQLLMRTSIDVDTGEIALSESRSA